MKILRALLLAGCVATAAQAAPTDPAAVNEFKSQMTLASIGDRNAQYRVGEMYEKGLGTEPDLPLAIIWYSRAAQQGDNRAAERLSALDHSNARDVKANEQLRVDAVMKALRQQESDEAVRTRANREKRGGKQRRTRRRPKRARASRPRMRLPAPARRPRPKRRRPGRGARSPIPRRCQPPNPRQHQP